MEKKYAYQLDNFGIFVGMAERQASPLEDGVWLIPGGAVVEPDMSPIPPGKHARYVNGDWIYITANEALNARNAFQVDDLGFFVQFHPKTNFVNELGGYTYPAFIHDSPAVPVLADGQAAQLVNGTWHVMSVVAAALIKYPPEA